MSNKFGVIFVLILIGIIGPMTKRLEAQSSTITVDGYFGCVDRGYFNRLWTYKYEKDMEAFQKGLTLGLSQGSCTLFKAGEEVFIYVPAESLGDIKLRRKGEIVEYWTNFNILRGAK